MDPKQKNFGVQKCCVKNVFWSKRFWNKKEGAVKNIETETQKPGVRNKMSIKKDVFSLICSSLFVNVR